MAHPQQARLHEIRNHLWSQGKIVVFRADGTVMFTLHGTNACSVLKPAGSVSEYFSDDEGHVWRVRQNAE